MNLRNLILVGVSLVLVLRCAMQSNPTGGPRDEAPPEVSVAVPENYSTNFIGKGVLLTFDEYIVLKDPESQVQISPPLGERLKVSVKGKTLKIDFPDTTLLQNTTYTITFGKAIEDLHEGNVLLDYKYVLSTGSDIDSSSIRGVARTAFGDEPAKGYLAMLYPKGSTDSAPLKETPLYYSLTREDGSFSLNNIPEDSFKLFVLKDINLDFKISGGGEEIGYFPQPIMAEKAPQPVIVRTYLPDPEFRFLRSKMDGYGKMNLYFFGDGRGRYSLSTMGGSLGTDPIEVSDLNGDSISVWFDPISLSGDEIIVSIDQMARDTLSVDTTLNKPGFAQLRQIRREGLTPNDSLSFGTSIPIRSIDQNLILISVGGSDTLRPDALVLSRNQEEFKIPFSFIQGGTIRTWILPGAIQDIFGNQNEDTLAYTFKTLTEQDLSYLILTIQSQEDFPMIFELLNEKGEVVYHKNLRISEKMDIPYLYPGKFRMRVIWDENDNGVWDPGNYLEGKTPEWVSYYQEKIELRANWEIELTWILEHPRY